jgi:hypothetical protein
VKLREGEGCARGIGGALRSELDARVGVVAEKPGDVRECACAGPRRRAERAKLTGLAHGAEREKRDARGNGSMTGGPDPRDRERERDERAGEVTGADRSAPLGSEREKEGAREGELPLTGGVRLSGVADARARGLAWLSWVGWAAFSFSFSLDFLIPFLFSFSIGFSNPNSN